MHELPVTRFTSQSAAGEASSLDLDDDNVASVFSAINCKSTIRYKQFDNCSYKQFDNCSYKATAAMTNTPSGMF
jgi:hypothetical protein